MSSRFRLYCKRHAHSGSRSPYWKGGITPERVSVFGLEKYQEWRNSVFRRDFYTCQNCGKKSGCGKTVIIEADHIKPWILYPELRYDLNNGQTLCVECHRLKTKSQAKETNHYLRNKSLT